MKSLKLNDGDLQFVNGRLKLISGEEQIIQVLENALSIRKGEWFYNVNSGLSHEEFYKKNPDFDNLKALLLETIFSIEEVDQVDNIEINFDNQSRTCTINFDATINENTQSLEVTI